MASATAWTCSAQARVLEAHHGAHSIWGIAPRGASWARSTSADTAGHGGRGLGGRDRLLLEPLPPPGVQRALASVDGVGPAEGQEADAHQVQRWARGAQQMRGVIGTKPSRRAENWRSAR